MKRSSFLKRLLGIGGAIVLGPHTKLIALESEKKRIPEQIPVSTHGKMSVKKQLPIAVIVENISGQDVRDVEVFGAYDSINEYFNLNGTMYNDKVLIKSGTPGMTYRDILYMLMLQPFHSSLLYITCINPDQFKNRITLKKRDRNGKICTIPFMPIYSMMTLYHYSHTIFHLKSDTVYQGDTKMVISRLLKDEKMEFIIYPSTQLVVWDTLNKFHETGKTKT